jgi:hypothetical protein
VAEPLNRLISSTQTIGGAASLAGTPSPITPVGATGIGANQDAAKMAGTPNQKQSAMVRNLRESTPESAQAVFQQASAPKKSKTVADLEQAAASAKFAANLSGRVAVLATKEVEAAATKTAYASTDFLKPETIRRSTTFPAGADANVVSASLAVIFGEADASSPQYQKAVTDLKAQGVQVGQNPSELWAAFAPPEAKVTDKEIADRILNGINPDVKLGQLNNPAHLEAIGGPGYSAQDLRANVEAVTGKPFDPAMSWKQAVTLVQEWKQRSLQDYQTLQQQATSSNENVAQEANQRLREMGFFGGQTLADKIVALDPEASMKVKLPTAADATLADLTQGTPAGRQALVEIVAKLRDNPAFLDTVDPALSSAIKKVADQAQRLGQVSDMDVQQVQQANKALDDNKKFWSLDAEGNPTGPSMDGLEAVLGSDFVNQQRAGGLLSPKDVPNSAYQMYRDPSIPSQTRQQLRVAFEEAATNPEVARLLKTLTPDQLRTSALVADAKTFSERTKQAGDVRELLSQAPSNPSAKDLLLSKVFGPDYVKTLQAALKSGIRSINGVSLVKPGTTDMRDPIELAKQLMAGVTTANMLAGKNPLSDLQQKYGTGALKTQTTKVRTSAATEANALGKQATDVLRDFKKNTKPDPYPNFRTVPVTDALAKLTPAQMHKLNMDGGIVPGTNKTLPELVFGSQKHMSRMYEVKRSQKGTPAELLEAKESIAYYESLKAQMKRVSQATQSANNVANVAGITRNAKGVWVA